MLSLSRFLERVHERFSMRLVAHRAAASPTVSPHAFASARRLRLPNTGPACGAARTLARAPAAILLAAAGIAICWARWSSLRGCTTCGCHPSAEHVRTNGLNYPLRSKPCHSQIHWASVERASAAGALMTSTWKGAAWTANSWTDRFVTAKPWRRCPSCSRRVALPPDSVKGVDVLWPEWLQE